jgi:protein tyrosine phosphatase
MNREEQAERAAALHFALTEWKDAGGPAEAVVMEILEMIESACQSQDRGGK